MMADGKAKTYRQRAGRIRNSAGGLPPGETKKTLLDVANEYDRMAEETERKGPPPAKNGGRYTRDRQ